MSNWNTGKYADPILPEGDAIFTIITAKPATTAGGTPSVSIMAKIDEFLTDYDVDDESILAPLGQFAFGDIWLPKPEDDPKKATGKARRARSFVEIMMAAGADVDTDAYDNPVDVINNNMATFVGKSFKAQIEQRVDESGTYPTRAGINFFRARRA